MEKGKLCIMKMAVCCLLTVVSTGHISMYANHKPSAKGYYRRRGTPEKPGRDYVFSAPNPLFCLGYGLSYTSFSYRDLAVDNQLPGGSVTVRCQVKNTGKREGAEVVQLYLRDKVSSVTTPVKALKAFRKIYLRPGEEQTVAFSLSADDLKLWNRDMQFVLEPGKFEVYIGSSVEDIHLQDVFEVR